MAWENSFHLVGFWCIIKKTAPSNGNGFEIRLRFGIWVFEMRSCKSFDNLVLLCSVVLFVAPDCDEAGGVASLYNLRKTQKRGETCVKVQKLPPKLSNQAAKKISGMDSKDKVRVKQSILDIPAGDIKPFKGSKGSYRLREGNWRVIFSWISNEQIFVEKIDLRGQVYKGV